MGNKRKLIIKIENKVFLDGGLYFFIKKYKYTIAFIFIQSIIVNN